MDINRRVPAPGGHAVAGRAAQKLQAEEVDRTTRKLATAVLAGIDVSEVYRQECVVITNRGAEKQRLFLIETESESR